MASLRPEGALNSSKGLVELGRTDDALDSLHLVLSNRRYRQWNATMEKIAEEYVKLCLMTGKPRYAKDGLIQFRNICQPNNLHSLDGVLKQFRSLAEDKVRETRGKLTTGADGLVDLDEVESGESLLLSALSPDAAVADERAARSALRDLWDTLRTILEVCRNHPALDETYHATAVMAFDFCSEFKRRNEFRRICDTLRLHQQQASFKTTSSSIIGGQVPASAIDPLTRTIETRTYQMKVAADLGLWTTAFHTAEELFALLSRKRPSQSQLITYYSNLSKILWMSSNAQQHQLFHATCVLKHAALNLSTQTADEAVVSVLATSVADYLAQQTPSYETTVEGGDGSAGTDFAQDKSARMTVLTGSGSVPTTQSLLSDLIAKDLVSHASEKVKKIYTILNFSVEKSSSSLVSTSAELSALLNSLPVELVQYRPALARFALVKITHELQSMYSCIGFEKFESLTSGILPFEESVKLLGQLKRTDQVDVCIDYQSRTIAFGASPSASSGISSAVEVLRQAVGKIHGEKLALKTTSLFDEENFFTRLDAERNRCEDRRNAADSRKDAIELSHIRKAQEVADQLKRAEEERLEADAKARATESARREAETKRREEELIKAKAVADKIILIGGTEVANLSDDSLVELGVDKLEKMLKDQVAKERLDRISKRRNESKRLEHTARLFRLAENEQIAQWAACVYDKDKALFELMAQEKADEWRKAAEAKRASVNALKPFGELLAKWKASRIEEVKHKIARSIKQHSRQNSNDSEAVESDVAPTSTLSRDEFKEMARSLPSWKDPSPVDTSE